MKNPKRFAPWYFLSVLCICLCLTFPFLSFGLSKSNKALGSDGGWRGPVGGQGWWLQPLQPRASQPHCKTLFSPIQFACFGGISLLLGLAVPCRDYFPQHIHRVRPVLGSAFTRTCLFIIPGAPAAREHGWCLRALKSTGKQSRSPVCGHKSAGSWRTGRAGKSRGARAPALSRRMAPGLPVHLFCWGLPSPARHVKCFL